MAKKLLLVEDSITIQTIVKHSFAQDEFEIMVAGDATHSLHLLRAAVPDIVLADASMPGMDGFQLCHVIRQTEALRHLPVVLLTSSFTVYDTTKGERVGVTAHLAKPFDAEDLRRLVQQLVSPSPRSGAAFAASAAVSVHVPPPIELLEARPPESLPSDSWPLPHGLVPAPALAGALPPPPAQDLVPPPLVLPQPVFPPAMLEEALHQMLSNTAAPAIRHAIQTTLTTQLSLLLEQLTPQLLTMIQEVVTAQAPQILAALLRQEIDKLKQAVERDSDKP